MGISLICLAIDETIAVCNCEFNSSNSILVSIAFKCVSLISFGSMFLVLNFMQKELLFK
jgi:hypothetical protein